MYLNPQNSSLKLIKEVIEMKQQNLEMSGEKSKEPAKPSDFQMEESKKFQKKNQSDSRNVSEIHENLVKN